jgi:ABC-type sulfate transport system substrate-binding protein
MSTFPALELFQIGEIAGGWAEANERFFAEGGVFDEVYDDR